MDHCEGLVPQAVGSLLQLFIGDFAMTSPVTRRRLLQFSAAAALVASRFSRADDLPPADPASASHHELAAAYSAEHRGISLLVMVAGKVVFEDYPGGGRANRTHELASGTKSFCCAIAAAAIADGLIESWDENVAGTITEWKDDPRRSQITLRQLLSLTSGIAGGGIARVPAYADAIANEATAAPGERFAYGPVPFQVFGELMRRKLAGGDKQEGVLDYLHRRVLDPIGLAHGFWRKDKDGNPHLPSGAALAAREWSKYGELVRLGGRWEGKEVLPQHTLDECFVGSKANPAYGLSWWLNRPVDQATVRRIPLLRRAQDLAGEKHDLAPDLVFAAGAGDQRLYVSRKLGLVVARQAAGIAAALAGRRDGFSDRELLSRLLLGRDASGKEIDE
jgi:CubicO group peptidase (beta-lactamase class C family)